MHLMSTAMDRLSEVANLGIKNFRTNQLALGFFTADLPDGHHKVRVVVRKSENSERKSKHLCIYNAIVGTKLEA